MAGRFYDEDGSPTEALAQAQALIEEGQRMQTRENERKKRFPPCNSEWSSTGGSRVWCSKQRYGLGRVAKWRLAESVVTHQRCSSGT